MSAKIRKQRFYPYRLDHAVRRRLATAWRPVIEVVPAGDMTIEWNVPVVVRDGTTLRVNVFRPRAGGPFPVIASAQPYGKDAVPRKTRSGRGVSMQYRIMPQPAAITFSDLTSWEAPDPDFWVGHGYAVVSIDLRGGGTSEGVADLFSAQEGEDYHDVVEWIAAQPWCTGRVGLDGVSYLAISQYRVAATRPAHLAAICPWEGFTDLYRDSFRPGGIRETGFSVLWGTVIRSKARTGTNLVRELRTRAERDQWYAARTPDLSRIDVPMLVCGSFSDHCLHTRGAFEAFRRVGSQRKWLYTHRGGKWATYYGAEASAERLRFFDHFLKDVDNGWLHRPVVRLATYEGGPLPVAVTQENAWPPSDLTWTALALTAAGRLAPSPGGQGTASIGARRGVGRWVWRPDTDVDVIGPARLSLQVAVEGADDFLLFVVVRKVRDNRDVGFEGSYGLSADVVTHGWLRIAHRRLDPALTTPTWPVHTHDVAEPVRPGQVVTVDVALLPHATRVRAGEELRLELTGRWPVRRDPFGGGFPAGYAGSRRGRLRVYLGPGSGSALVMGWRNVSQG